MVKGTLQIQFSWDLEMGRYFELPGWAQCNHKDPYESEAGVSESGRFEEVVLLILKMEEGVTMQGM